MNTFKLFLAGASALALSTSVHATDLEVTHWWTSGGEAAAVAEFARMFDATGNKWVDGAIAGGGGTARPVMISRITGGDPMAATQFNHGRQAEELVEAGLMLDLTELAEKEGWKDIVNPPSLLDSCTLDGKIYCVPVNIHSPQWLWLSHAAYEKAGVAVPTNWDEFVAAAPKLREAGIQPLALGQQPWQSNLLFGAVQIGVGGLDLWKQINLEKDVAAASGPEMAKVFQAMADARDMADGSNVQDWNQATNMVITGTAGGQIMGDWAKGEFMAAGKVPGEDFLCASAPGEGFLYNVDSFAMFDVDGEDKKAGQQLLAELVVGQNFQKVFNLNKGSIPARTDVALDEFDDCARLSADDMQASSDGDALLPSYAHGMALRGAQGGAITDVVTAHFNSDMSSADAVQMLADGIANSM